MVVKIRSIALREKCRVLAFMVASAIGDICVADEASPDMCVPKRPQAEMTREVWHWNNGAWFSVPIGYLSESYRGVAHWKTSDFSKAEADLKRGAFSYGDTDVVNKNEMEIYGLPKYCFTIPFLTPSIGIKKSDAKAQLRHKVWFKILWPGILGVATFREVENFERAQRFPIDNPDIIQIFQIEYSLMLRCAEGVGCNGWAWDKKNDFIFFIIFPEIFREQNATDFWKEPLERAVALAMK